MMVNIGRSISSHSKQINLVGERFILEIHQNATNYCYFVDV